MDPEGEKIVGDVTLFQDSVRRTTGGKRELLKECKTEDGDGHDLTADRQHAIEGDGRDVTAHGPDRTCDDGTAPRFDEVVSPGGCDPGRSTLRPPPQAARRTGVSLLRSYR